MKIKFFQFFFIIFYLLWPLPSGRTAYFSAPKSKISRIKNTDFIDKKFYLQKLCAPVRYKMISPEKEMENLNLIGFESKNGVWGRNYHEKLYGMMLRCLRFQNITRKVEKRYGIPKNTILAIMMMESGGAEALPNCFDDGGVGLCHIQPLMARLFELKTYENCNEMTSEIHGKKIRCLINEYRSDVKELVNLDERFHPILNLDAVGRILSYHAFENRKEKDMWKNAISCYGGLDKYPVYYERVVILQKAIGDKTKIAAIRAEFNRLNPEFKLDGKKADFDDYIRYYHQQNRNFGLDDYK